MTVCTLAYSVESSRHYFILVNDVKPDIFSVDLSPDSPFLALVNARNALDLIRCANHFHDLDLPTSRRIAWDLEIARYLEMREEDFREPDPLLLAKEIHGQTPTSKQLKAARQATKMLVVPNTKKVDLLSVQDYYSISLLLRSALVLDSFSRGRCLNDFALSEFLSDSKFKIEISCGGGVNGWLIRDLMTFSIGAPFYCEFDYDEGRTVYLRLESPFETRDIRDMKTAARKLSNDIFNLHLGGVSPKREQGKTHYYYYHYLCKKYFELAMLCDSNRIGVCGHCGNVFISDKTRGKQRLYCSDSCRVMEWKDTHPKPSDTPKA
jgi:hypothetical protein